MDEVFTVVGRAAAGEIVMPVSDRTSAPGRLRGSPSEHELARMTPRETQVLRGLAAGRTAAQIAASLGISALTVQSHVKSILVKLGVHSKIEAVTLAWRHGLIPIEGVGVTGTAPSPVELPNPTTSRRIARGERIFTQAQMQGALAELGRRARRSREETGEQPNLSAREIEVLEQAARGFTVGQIARRMALSPRTVETHLGNAYRKLGVHNRLQALARASRLGLIRIG